MNKTKIAKMIIILLLICCVVLLSFIILIFRDLLNQDSNIGTEENKPENTIEDINKDKTIEDILVEYDIELLSIKDYVIRLNFPKDLYDEEGNSNERYFNNLIEAIKPFYPKKNFTLLDPIRNIEISVTYSKDKEKYIIKINGLENYYENVDGDTYAEVDNTKIEESANIVTTNVLLSKLANNNSYFSSIEDMLEEDRELEDGYVSYNNGQIKIKKTLINTVRNIILTSDYEGEINRNINVKTSLEEILEKYPKNAFGSLEEGYLGYISREYYYFFYNDEISIYSYSYSENKQFEKFLKNYLETKDLDKFVSLIKSNYKVYDSLEYDSEIKKAHIVFSNRGIEIDIKDNNPKGITLYSNYLFSETSKRFVREGLINLNSHEDLVNKMEVDRRK